MAILNIKNYKTDVIKKVLDTLKKDYFICNPNYKTDLKTIYNIFDYLVKHNFKYNTKNCMITFDNKFYSQISSPSDYYTSIDDCIDDFILTASCEILNLIQNKYFNKVTLKYEYAA